MAEPGGATIPAALEAVLGEGVVVLPVKVAAPAVAKVRAWRMQPFLTHTPGETRTDSDPLAGCEAGPPRPLRLWHWEPADDQPLSAARPYVFEKFNVGFRSLKFDYAFYKGYLCEADWSWTWIESGHLLALVERFEANWVVVVDRYDLFAYMKQKGVDPAEARASHVALTQSYAKEPPAAALGVEQCEAGNEVSHGFKRYRGLVDLKTRYFTIATVITEAYYQKKIRALQRQLEADKSKRGSATLTALHEERDRHPLFRNQYNPQVDRQRRGILRRQWRSDARLRAQETQVLDMITKLQKQVGDHAKLGEEATKYAQSARVSVEELVTGSNPGAPGKAVLASTILDNFKPCKNADSNTQMLRLLNSLAVHSYNASNDGKIGHAWGTYKLHLNLRHAAATYVTLRKHWYRLKNERNWLLTKVKQLQNRTHELSSSPKSLTKPDPGS